MEIVVDVSPSDSGAVAVNGDLAGSYPETFSLDKDTYDVSIEAIPAPGYCFVGWTVKAHFREMIILWNFVEPGTLTLSLSLPQRERL